MVFLEYVQSGFVHCIDWIGYIVRELTDDQGHFYALLPLLCIGIGVSVLIFASRAIRSFIWGA